MYSMHDVKMFECSIHALMIKYFLKGVKIRKMFYVIVEFCYPPIYGHGPTVKTQ